MKAKFLLFVDAANLCPGNIFAAVLAVGFVAGVPPFLAEAKRFIILTGDFSVLSHFYASSRYVEKIRLLVYVSVRIEAPLCK